MNMSQRVSQQVLDLESAERLDLAAVLLYNDIMADPAASTDDMLAHFALDTMLSAEEGPYGNPTVDTDTLCRQFREVLQVLHQYHLNSPDATWFFGLYIFMYPWTFDMTEEQGEKLMQRARELNSVWRDDSDAEDHRRHLSGRGIISSYYSYQ
jgi:hypothetical protein